MFTEGGRNSSLINVPEFDTSVIRAGKQKPLVKGNLTLSDPVGVSYE